MLFLFRRVNAMCSICDANMFFDLICMEHTVGLMQIHTRLLRASGSISIIKQFLSFEYAFFRLNYEK